MLILALTDDFRVWEHRIGSFNQACQQCGQPAWQLVFRIYRNKGSMLAPPNEWTPPIAERYQVRCCACGGASPAGHPSTWVHTLTTPFQHETYPVTVGHPMYSTLALSRPF
jgi:hypothetical protein